MSPTNETEIENIIRSFTAKKSYGHDLLSSSLIKQVYPCLLTVLTHIFNEILTQGIFPGNFKMATIRPIFKNGSSK